MKASHNRIAGKLQALEPEDREALSEVAVTSAEENRSGTFVLKDASPVCSYSYVDGIELLPIADALETYDWLRERYYWGLIPEETSPLSQNKAFSEKPLGYFLRVKEGEKAKLPSQAALYMTGSLGRQLLHNVVILEEDAELELITGCVSNPFMKGASTSR